jgi:hypothetical protein
VAIALGAPPALGQRAVSGSATAPLSESLSGSAKDAYTSAQRLIGVSDFEGAYIKYEQAYALSKDPRLLYNMAVCARSLKQYARMQALLTRYQREGQGTISAEDQVDVANALAAIHRLVGTVRVAATEEGAAVAIDGVVVGTTPLADPLVIDLGSHTVTVTKPDFAPVERTIDVAGGAETVLTFTLMSQRHAARLVVSSDEEATVVIDGRVAGKGHFDGQVAKGVHEVRLTETGKLPYRAQLDLHDGETRTMEVTLENEPRAAAVWPWIVGGAAVIAGAAVGGYFLFKPSDTVIPVPAGKFGAVTLASWSPR